MGSPRFIRAKEGWTTPFLHRLSLIKHHDGEGFISYSSFGRVHRLLGERKRIQNIGCLQRILESCHQTKGSVKYVVRLSLWTIPVRANALRDNKCTRHVPTCSQHHLVAVQVENLLGLYWQHCHLLRNGGVTYASLWLNLYSSRRCLRDSKNQQMLILQRYNRISRAYHKTRETRDRSRSYRIYSRSQAADDEDRNQILSRLMQRLMTVCEKFHGVSATA